MVSDQETRLRRDSSKDTFFIRALLYIVCCYLLFAGKAYASCLLQTVGAPLVASIDTITASADITAGASLTGDIDYEVPVSGCVGQEIAAGIAGGVAMSAYSSPTGKPIYELGSGVGFTIQYIGSSPVRAPAASVNQFLSSSAPALIIDTNNPGVVVSYKFRIHLYAIGPLIVGPLSNKNIIAMLFSAGAGTYSQNISSSSYIGSPNIINPTCTITTPSVAVMMDSAPPSALNVAGATYFGKNFQIGLNCPSVGGATKVFMTLTDGTNQANTSTVLSLNSSSTATNTGLQLFYNGASTPLSYGPINYAAPILGGGLYQGQIDLGMSTTLGNANLPFVVKYIAVNGPATAGTVNATAIFTMSYR